MNKLKNKHTQLEMSTRRPLLIMQLGGGGVTDRSLIHSLTDSPFPVFKPEELRQALMPTLESLYRQDPESLPFRQPVDPQLLGIPVRIRTSNKTNLVRDCTGCHFASTPLKI